MLNLKHVPDPVGGVPVISDLSLGFLGEAYLGAPEGGGIIMMLLLDEGEAFEAPASDPALITFARRGEDEGRALVAADVPAATPIGLITGGSSLQTRALQTGEHTDPDQAVARRLRPLDLRARIALMRKLCAELERLHGAGRTLTAISPWNVLSDGDALKVVDVAFALTPERCRWAHDDALIYLAPEVLKELGSGEAPAGSTAADVYAFAATARAFLLHTAARPTPESRGALFERAEIELAPQELYCDDLDDALRACVASDPAARPSIDALGKALAAALSGDVEHSPQSSWTTMVATAMAIVFCITVLMTFLRPQSQEELAVSAFVQASQETDPETRSKLLDDAWIHTPGHGQRTLAAARRLQAVDAFVAWQQSGEAEGLEQVLSDLEEHAVEGWNDELAHTARFVIGFLLRWEVGEDGRQHGDHLLEQPFPTPELAGLAQAARTLHAAGGVPGPRASAWLQAAQSAGGAEGILNRELPQTVRADRSVTPAGVSLQAGWIADLLAGRLLAAQGQSEAALTKLRAAEERIGTFSTEASLGLALVELGGDPGEAREVLERAKARRQPTELQLALARSRLREAHTQRTADAYKAASEAFRALEGTTPEEPDVERVQASSELAAVGVMEAAFYSALAKARAAELGPAEKALTALLRTYRNNDGFWDRFGPDTRVALGVVLVRGGRGSRARRDLLYMFRDRDLRAGWAALPKLDPKPFTRDRMLVLSALLKGVQDDLPQIRALAESDPSEARAAAREAQSDLNALLALAEAKTLPAFQRQLAQAELELSLAVVSRDATAGLEKARQAFHAMRADLKPATQTAEWLTATRRLEEIYRLQLGRARTAIEKLPALLGAYEDLRAVQSLPPAARKGAADLRDRLEATAKGDLNAAIGALLSERRGAWDAIKVDDPTYPGPVELELRALRRGVTLTRAAHGELDERRRLRLGLFYWRWSQLLWTQASGKLFAVARAGLEVLEPAGKKAAGLRSRFEHLLGTVAYRRPELIQDAVKGSGARSVLGFARDSLARACGEADFRTLWSKAKGGGYSPRGPEAAARLLASTLVDQVRRALPDDAGPNEAVPKADEHARSLKVALQLSPNHPTGCATLALVELCRSKGSSTKLESILALTRRALKATPTNTADLEAFVLATRVDCWARALGGDGGVGDAAFGKRASAGAKRARQLFERDPAARSRPSNHGPAYWLARYYAQAGDAARAKSAFAAFGAQLGSTPPPPEAKNWKREASAARGGD